MIKKIEKLNYNLLWKIYYKFIENKRTKLMLDLSNFVLVKKILYNEYLKLFNENYIQFIAFDLYCNYNDNSFLCVSDLFIKMWSNLKGFENKSDEYVRNYIYENFRFQTDEQKISKILSLLSCYERINCLFMCLTRYYSFD